jgi:hypothetical protein
MRMRETWIEWRIATLETRCEQSQGAVAVKKTIWTMRKQELIEVARRELGLRHEQAEAITVIELREAIRAHREQTKVLLHPHASYPKGLSKMTAQELTQECAERGLLVDRATRPQMIAAIRNHVLTVRSDEDWTMEMGSAAGSARSPSLS